MVNFVLIGSLFMIAYSDIIESALGVFNRDFDDLVVEDGETNLEKYVV